LELSLPLPVAYVLGRLEEKGYAAYAVGGCIRDRLLNREPNDWDIACSALPQEISAVFSGKARILPTGLQHGTVTLLLEGWQIEATTFRIDGPYTGHRRPEQVSFTDDIEKDLARRDFTINAMAYSPLRGFADPFGGQEDLKRGRLRCVGAPVQRFTEDALRILRAVRFLAQLGFSPEERTRRAIFSERELLRAVSAERLTAETGKLLCALNAEKVLREYREVLAVFLPEIERAEGESWECILRAIGRLPACLPLRLAALISFAAGGEDMKENARCADSALRRLHYDNRTRETVDFLIENREAPVLETALSVRRWLCRAGEERFFSLLSLRRAFSLEDMAALEALDEAERLARDAIRQGMPLSPGELAVGGSDLLCLGVLAGPQVGQLLRLLHERVIEGSCENSREALLHLLEREGWLQSD
jgi:tRNA nucleotidyltransferase (CCA-adding enzyme)